MITLTIQTEKGQISVNHNGDWSGDAQIFLEDMTSVVIPGKVLLRIGNAAAIDKVRETVIEALEELE